jgi:hypothetical protein
VARFSRARGLASTLYLPCRLGSSTETAAVSDVGLETFAHRAVLLAPTEDLFGHFAAGLGDLVADVADRARIDRTPAPLASLGEA